MLVGLAALHCAGAPLVLKDDFRSPRNKERPLRKATRLIVLHTTEAHARSSLNKLSERGEAHYCLTEKGEAYRIVDRDREAFHAGRSMWNAKEDCDEFSIGIEVVGHHDQAMPVVQLEALKELVARLKKMYGVADAQVVCHSHVAYGAPNQWHKCKHRGRKRCGMLFAMPSVRAKLGLRARPAYDPDVRAKRLIQADDYLNTVLYGNTDTMASTYGRPKAALVAAPPAPAPKAAPRPPAKVPAKAAPKVVAKTPPKAAPKTAPKVVAKTPPKAAPAPVAKPAPKAAVQHPVLRPVARTAVVAAPPAPPPVRRPVLIVPPTPAEPVSPAPPASAPPASVSPASAAAQPEQARDWLATIGLKGGYFRKRARLVTPEPAPATEPEPPPADDAGPWEPATPEAEAESESAEDAGGDAAAEDPSPVLPLPKHLHVGRMGDDLKDLEALAKLPGYTRGGPVNAENSPFRIAGAAWRLPTTYYWSPRGQIVTGDKVDEKSVEAGTFIFFKKQGD